MKDQYTYQLVKLLKELSQHLRLVQKEFRAWNDRAQLSDERQHAGHDRPPQSIKAEITALPSPLITHLETTSRQVDWEKKHFIVSVATLAALVLTLIAVVLQWSAMEATVNEMRAQTANLAETSHLDQRAWVVVTSTNLSQFSAGKEVFVDFLLTNTGKTPARQLHFTRFFAWRMATEEDLKQMKDSYSGNTNLAPGERRTQRFTVTPPIHPERHKAVLDGKMTFAIVGAFNYRDAFSEEERSTPVCVYFDNRSAPLMTSCNVGNRVMK